jgi:hypothetical protein
MHILYFHIDSFHRENIVFVLALFLRTISQEYSLVTFIFCVLMYRVVASDSGDERANNPAANISSDDPFGVLSHHRRRYIIECLTLYGSPMTLPDLADECVMMEHQCAINEIPAETVKRMYMSLYHTHIPKLVEADVVEYDQESDSVALGQNADQLDSQRTLTRSTLPASAAHALSELRSAVDADIDNYLTTDQAIAVIEQEEPSDGEAQQLLHLLEDRGYIYIVDRRVRLIE